MPSPLTLTRSSPTRLLTHRMFDRVLKGMQRSRVDPSGLSSDVHKLVAEQMLDRRTFVKRETPVILEVGAHTGWFLRHMLEQHRRYKDAIKGTRNGGLYGSAPAPQLDPLQGLKQYIQTDISEERLNYNYDLIRDIIPPEVELVQICCDEEIDQSPNPFGIPERSVDLIVSCLAMHWVNDLEMTMVNLRRTLKRDCFLLMSMFGGNTLFEMRSSFSLAMNEVHGGLGTHVSPMIDGAGISSLLLQSGFSLPSIDLDRHVLLYESPFHVMEHLQAMGESACHIHRRPLDRATLAAVTSIYQGLYSKERYVPATFEIFHCIAWSPGPNQSQPLPRGSGAVPLGAISTSDHKELQGILEQYARNPNDKDLEEKADKILKQMQETSEADLSAKGIDTRPLKGRDPFENFAGKVVPPE